MTRKNPNNIPSWVSVKQIQRTAAIYGEDVEVYDNDGFPIDSVIAAEHICDWCKKVILGSESKTEEISHGICKDCAEKWREDAKRDVKKADERTFVDGPSYWPEQHDDDYGAKSPAIPQKVDPDDEGKLDVEMPPEPPYHRRFPTEEYMRRSLFPITDVASDKESDFRKNIEFDEVGEEDQYPEFTRERLSRGNK